MNNHVEQVLSGFKTEFGSIGNASGVFFAPGRVNLIGEHTDYNGGFVLPVSLNYGTWLAASVTGGNKIALASANFPGKAICDTVKSFARSPVSWANYPLGVMNEFAERGFSIPGMNLFFFGDIPNGAGLSSSASIEMVTAFALNDILNAGLEMTEIIRLCQHAENEFVGMKCGIMDQFAVGTGLKDHALFLNCDTLDYRMIPLQLHDFDLLITNSGVKRELAASAYNQRRMECETAVQMISRKKKIRNLGELGLDDLDWCLEIAGNEILSKRIRHVVAENWRVLEAVSLLPASRIQDFGRLMFESHRSLKDDYEVSCNELDLLVEIACDTEGVAGSRMTGAGFGGCTVTLVNKDKTSSLMERISRIYTEKMGLQPAFYLPDLGASVEKFTF